MMPFLHPTRQDCHALGDRYDEGHGGELCDVLSHLAVEWATSPKVMHVRAAAGSRSSGPVCAVIAKTAIRLACVHAASGLITFISPLAVECALDLCDATAELHLRRVPCVASSAARLVGGGQGQGQGQDRTGHADDACFARPGTTRRRLDLQLRNGVGSAKEDGWRRLALGERPINGTERAFSSHSCSTLRQPSLSPSQCLFPSD